MKCREKEDKDFLDKSDSQKSIIINVKINQLFFDHQHNTILTKIKTEEITMYVSKAQEIVTRWNNGLKKD